MTRLLGIDLGTRRVGLAIAEADGVGARPLATVNRRRSVAADAAVLGELIAANRVDELVVGLPLDMDGGEGAMAAAARAWASELAHHLALPVRLRDERLSSHVAEGRLGPAGRGRAGGPPGRVRRERRRARVDREAAAVILEDELAARRAGQPGEPVPTPEPDHPQHEEPA